MTEKIRRTPTETLVAAMEEAEKAIECLVIMTNSDGEILTIGSTSIIDAYASLEHKQAETERVVEALRDALKAMIPEISMEHAPFCKTRTNVSEICSCALAKRMRLRNVAHVALAQAAELLEKEPPHAK